MNPGVSGKSKEENWSNPVKREGQKEFIEGSKEIGRSDNLFGRSDLSEQIPEIKDDGKGLMKAHVVEALARSPEVDASNIEITVNGSKVYLAGYVDDIKEKTTVIKVIQNLRGVKEVEDHLTVRGGNEHVQ